MNSRQVAIVDGGGANIASLQFALERLGANSELTTNPQTICAASHVILPGVGAAAAAMEKIRTAGLHEVLPTLDQPVLGICLGMQLLAGSSRENDTTCLGIFPATAEALSASPEMPVPNMGWCRTHQQNPNCPLFDGITDDSWFYFVHSYALPVSKQTVGTATHTSRFSAVMAAGNFFATQFHPERSATAGARLLQNFLQITQ